MPLRVIVSFAPTFSYVSSDCSGTAFRTETFASDTCVDRSHAHGESDDIKLKLTCHTTASSQMMVKSTGFSNSADCSGTGPTEETPFPTGACLSNGNGSFEKWSCNGSTMGALFAALLAAVSAQNATNATVGANETGTFGEQTPTPVRLLKGFHAPPTSASGLPAGLPRIQSNVLVAVVATRKWNGRPWPNWQLRRSWDCCAEMFWRVLE